MTIHVNYLSEEEIERDAQSLLEEYFHEQGKPIEIPVPAEEILEIHLGLSLDFDDLQQILGIPGVLGALWAERREVFIDQSLEPEEHPGMEGRYHFSVGHEIGHWRLHRHYLMDARAKAATFVEADHQPTIPSSTTQTKKRIEWRADYFSSCFLMPRQFVLDDWHRYYGNHQPIVYADIAAEPLTHRPVRRRRKPIQMKMILSDVIQQTLEPHVYAFDKVARKFAPGFRVSNQAMRIRLEKLGLLRVDHPIESDLFVND